MRGARRSGCRRPRQSGYRAGINVLSTMGHHNENLPNSLSGDYTRVTDIDGNTCQGSFCPNDPRLQEYVRRALPARGVGRARTTSGSTTTSAWPATCPCRLTCFCDRCLAIFEKETRHEVHAGRR